MQPLLSVSDVTKSYPNVRALESVSLHVYPGEVHAVIGENGAGKSTLVSILSGFVTPDAGTGSFEGRPLPFGQAGQLRRLGIELVHQHFMLVDNLRVDENLALAEVTATTFNLARTSAEATILADQLGWKIDFVAKVADLPVGAQQRVEILKALLSNPRVLILDEPTAVLSPDEVANLLEVLRKLKSNGVAVVLIAHKIAEVLAIADRITVLRRGNVVGTVLGSETDATELTELMVGESTDWPTKGKSSTGQPALILDKVSVLADRGNRAIDQLSLTLSRGEILGIGGVDGNGQVELAEAVAGVRPVRDGTVKTTGTVAYVPQDRQTDGLAVSLTVKENLALAAVDDPAFRRGLLLDWPRIQGWAQQLVDTYAVKTPSVEVLASALSGGNQQKVVVARALAGQPDILVAVNPTRGLDVKATEFVHRQISLTAQRGAGVLLISTDADELALLSDRSFYLTKGRLVETLSGALS